MEKLFQVLRVLVGRRTVVSMIDPQHRDVRLHLSAEMQQDGFVRAEVRGNHRAAVRPSGAPADDFERRLTP